MPFKNNRNSREDKSLKHNRFEGNSKNERPKRSNSGPGKMFDGDRKPAEDRSTGRKKYGESPTGRGGDSRPFRERSTEGRSSEGRSFEKRPYNKDQRDDHRPTEGRSFEKRPYNKDQRDDRRPSEGRSFEKRPYNKDQRDDRGPSEGRSFEKRPYNKDQRDDRRPSEGRSFEKRPYNKDQRDDRRPSEGRSFEKRPYNKDQRDDRRPSEGRSFEKRPYNKDQRDDRRPSEGRSFEKRPYSGDKRSFGGEKRGFGADRPSERKPHSSGSWKYEDGESRKWTSEEHIEHEPNLRSRKKAEGSTSSPKDGDLIRLNRYIANAGICSRRKADELIEAGVVTVNGEVISELGHKINPMKDQIRYNGELLRREKMVYVLLNKPKDYITTTDDPQERRTVMQLVEKASKERIYPVGRLDRNTTGLLLMTNDGDLAEKLSHPRNNITKIYQVELSKSLTQGDLNKIAFGLELEDGVIKPDLVTYVQGGTKREVGIQIHSGKNRIVRRIFEHLGYEVVKLDRVVYANLTKKDLPRGRWRYLEEKEIIQLKHFIK